MSTLLLPAAAGPTFNAPAAVPFAPCASPSAFARGSLNVPLPAGAWPVSFTCVLCGSPRPAGGVGLPLPVSNNFSDWPDLVGVYGPQPRPEEVVPVAAGRRRAPRVPVCGDCAAFLNKPTMQGTQAALFTGGGALAVRGDTLLGFTRGQVIKHLLLNLPPPPFLWVMNSGSATSLAHMVWRTPVTVDARRVLLRYGSRLLTIRPRLLEAFLPVAERVALALGITLKEPADAKAARELREAIEAGESWPRWRIVRRLFMAGGLDFTLTEPFAGRPAPHVLHTFTPEERTIFFTLGPGEWMALCYLSSNLAPVPPPPLILKVRAGSALDFAG